MREEGAQGGNGSKLLATTDGTGGVEKTSALAVEAASSPDTTSPVPENLPLGGKGTESGRDTEQECIIFEQLIGLL